MILIDNKLFAQLLCMTLFSIASFSAMGQAHPDKDDDLSTSSYSGFLKDYSKLKKTVDSQGNALLRWVDPVFKAQHLQQHKFLVRDVEFFPEAKPTKQVSSLVLEEIRHYIESNLRERLGVHDLLADAPGEGVFELRLAITAVNVKAQGLRPWELIPVALIRAGIQSVSGRRNQHVRLLIESELVNSQTNQVVLQSVREGKGLSLDNENDPLTLDKLKPKMDQWIEAVMDSITKQGMLAK